MRWPFRFGFRCPRCGKVWGTLYLLLGHYQEMGADCTGCGAHFTLGEAMQAAKNWEPKP